ncbi:hypothetical protein A2768_01535 [Candidatus Roizmanbacteria bacterium RIFCSPHIGHO2_01_FULL_37_16]|nr:MAG: hypothetical protein A2768_01535 [Candidatus Roizmanbacteria bacterium RIFCSPHIGHO2_01_FULL_37_16]OGK26327.1 MAG: hypothetical protein A3D76_01400 [Candidatus Roizmanbacteria bacterium RIFCSPHIGHO2_02_FULL_37_9b]
MSWEFKKVLNLLRIRNESRGGETLVDTHEAVKNSRIHFGDASTLSRFLLFIARLTRTNYGHSDGDAMYFEPKKKNPP